MAYELDRQHGNEYRTSTIYGDKRRKFTAISRHTIQNRSRDRVRFFENGNNKSMPILAKRMVDLPLIVETRRPKPPAVVVENRQPKPPAMWRTSANKNNLLKTVDIKSPRDKGEGWCGGQQPLIAPPSITAT
jgi:hypothetical protein